LCGWSEPHPEAPGRALEEPEPPRRQALKLVGALLIAYGGVTISRARADRNDALAFASGSLDDVLKALDAAPLPDPQISLVVPDLVENGAVVPVEVTSRLPGPQSIFVISEANPFPLVVRFFIPEGTDPFVATRIKVARSCNIYALVEADGRFHSAMKATQVTRGGCGA
jgi:sulfur-oxidizing protein SoxY